MRRAVHFLAFGLIFFTVRECGVNETYDRMKYGADSASERLGLPAAGRAWNEKIYPAVAGAATRSVSEGGAATLQRAERVTGSGSIGLRERARNAATSLKQALFDLLGGPAAAPSKASAAPPAPAP